MISVKICGIKNLDDIQMLNLYRPEYAGFIFTDSKRQLTKEQAKELCDNLDKGIKKVGVFVDADVNMVADTAVACGLDCVQLHGNETPQYIEELRKLLHNAQIWKAVRVNDNVDVFYLKSFRADAIVLDTYVEGSTGGTGKAFDWKLAGDACKSLKIILAGGLNPSNASLAARTVKPYCVDVSSGVETDGVKDRDKVREFIYTAKGMTNVMDKGKFGSFGGRYAPETLMNALIELEQTYAALSRDMGFLTELNTLLKEYAGRPSLLYYAKNMTEDLSGAKIYLKREDLNHTGSHKINNVLGQALVAKRMGKKRVIAETGAGQHGVATATAAALFGMECEVFMGKEDMERQKLNVFRMELLGASVRMVETGTGTLKDATSEAMREWASRVDDTFYIIGSVVGPHPYPKMVRDFQAVIGREAKKQIVDMEGRLPDMLIACVGGGSNAMGLFYPFIKNTEVAMVGAEAAGDGIDTGRHAASITKGSVGVFHGMKSYFLQDEEGQITPVYSISAGLDYPGIGPEHAWLKDSGRATYVPITDAEAVEAFVYLSKIEGIIPAIESAHAVAYAMKVAGEMGKDKIIIVNVSGRGDKDVEQIAKYMGREV